MEEGLLDALSPPQAFVDSLTHNSPCTHAEQIAQQQRIAEAAAAQASALEALGAVPEPVKRYLISLWTLLNAPQPNLAEIQSAYEAGWNRLTDKFYAKTEWPDAEIIAPLVNHGQFGAALPWHSSVQPRSRSVFHNNFSY